MLRLLNENLINKKKVNIKQKNNSKKEKNNSKKEKNNSKKEKNKILKPNSLNILSILHQNKKINYIKSKKNKEKNTKTEENLILKNQDNDNMNIIFSAEENLILKKQENDNINIIFSADENVVFSYCILLKSIIINTKFKERLRFYIVTPNYNLFEKYFNLLCLNLIPKEELNDRLDINVNKFINYLIPDKIMIDEVEKKKSFHDNSVGKPISNFNFIRYYFDKLLPINVNKCIYLDDDMIVKEEIKILFDSLDENYDFAAVYPSFPYSLDKNKWIVDSKFRGEISGNYLFNAGMYVFYRNICEKFDFTEKCHDISEKNKIKQIYLGGTQPVMNLVCKNIKSIDKKWNQCGLGENISIDDINNLSNIIKSSYLLHYTGSYKPWLVKLNKKNINFLEEWYVYLEDIKDSDLLEHNLIYDNLVNLKKINSDNYKNLQINITNKII